MGINISYLWGGSNSGGEDITKLPLDGGIMSVNATVLFPQSNNRDSEIGAWGFGVEDTDGAYTTIEPTQIIQSAQVNETGDNATRTFTINTSGLNSISSSLDLDKNWSLNSDSVQGYTSSEQYWILDKNTVGGNSNSGSWALSNDVVFGNGWSFGSSGITFSDNTVQTTAASDWKTGGNANTDAEFNIGTYYEGGVINNDFPYIKITKNGIYTESLGGEHFTRITPEKIYQYNITNSDSLAELDGENGLQFFDYYGHEIVYAKYQPSGITFADGTTQTTSAEGFKNGFSLNALNNGDSNLIYIPSYDDGSWLRANFGYGGFVVDYEGDREMECSTEGIKFGMSGNMHDPCGFSVYYGLTFPDGSTQSTAGIPEAPIDGNAYVRKNGAWVNINDI